MTPYYDKAIITKHTLVRAGTITLKYPKVLYKEMQSSSERFNEVTERVQHAFDVINKSFGGIITCSTEGVAKCEAGVIKFDLLPYTLNEMKKIYSGMFKPVLLYIISHGITDLSHTMFRSGVLKSHGFEGTFSVDVKLKSMLFASYEDGLPTYLTFFGYYGEPILHYTYMGVGEPTTSLSGVLVYENPQLIRNYEIYCDGKNVTHLIARVMHDTYSLKQDMSQDDHESVYHSAKNLVSLCQQHDLDYTTTHTMTDNDYAVLAMLI